MVAIILFVAGILIGSFLNVVSLRYRPGDRLLGKNITGRSRCPHCKKTLQWYELIPFFSFLIQAGKCRACHARLSWQYPIVEVIAGFFTAALPFFFYQYFDIAIAAATGAPLVGYYLFTAAWVLAAYTFIVISVIDFRYGIIPDRANLLLTLLGGVVIFSKLSFAALFPYRGSFLGPYATLFNFGGSVWWGIITAAFIGAVLFGFIIAVTKGRGMGMGDLKMIIPIGLLLGWPDVIAAIMAAFVLGAILSVILLFLKIKTLKDGVPFGPFLALGVFVIVGYGQSLLQWYFSIL